MRSIDLPAPLTRVNRGHNDACTDAARGEVVVLDGDLPWTSVHKFVSELQVQAKVSGPVFILCWVR